MTYLRKNPEKLRPRSQLIKIFSTSLLWILALTFLFIPVYLINICIDIDESNPGESSMPCFQRRQNFSQIQNLTIYDQGTSTKHM